MIKSLYETFVMIIIPAVFAVILGIPLGSILYLKPNKKAYFIANVFVNSVRSFPFLIFVVIIIPITRFIFNTAFGLLPATLPITIVAICLYARFVEQSFVDVNPKVIDYAKSLKVNNYQLVRYFLITESSHSLVLGLTSTIISVISYSSVMGIVGGGGIGDYIMRYGYYEYNYELVYKLLIVVALIVYLIQTIGNKIAKKLDKKGKGND